RRGGQAEAQPRGGGRRPAGVRPSSTAGRPGPAQATGRGARPRPLPSVQFGNSVQVLDSYIIEESEDGLCIIDQHALHERILYNQISARLDDGPLASQQLLVPELVELPKPEFYAVMDLREELTRFGMDIEEFGESTVIVRAFPQVLGKFDGASFFEDMLDELEGVEGARDVDGRLERLKKMMACKGAVKAGQRLSPEQIRRLLERRHGAAPTDTCPHGRPTTITLSRRELDRQFQRT
ncbi:MAG: DNA mismatch repair protein MutL, partial [Candidatus Brocadiia bacterium]